ncbi:MAG: hypothetical protein ACLSVD_17940 [Eggerthellaceae bacterium]
MSDQGLAVAAASYIFEVPRADESRGSAATAQGWGWPSPRDRPRPRPDIYASSDAGLTSFTVWI